MGAGASSTRSNLILRDHGVKTASAQALKRDGVGSGGAEANGGGVRGKGVAEAAEAEPEVETGAAAAAAVVATAAQRVDSVSSEKLLNQWTADAKLAKEKEVWKREGDYDAILVGGGPAAVASAMQMGFLGWRCAIIEGLPIVSAAPTGAISKSLREAALAFYDAEGGVLPATRAGRDRAWKTAIEVRTRMLGHAEDTADKQLREFHINVVRGWGRVVSADGEVEVMTDDGQVGTLRAKRAVVVATGSKAARRTKADFSQTRFIFDSDTICELDRLPKSMVVHGGSIVAVEFAQIFAKFGVHVTVLSRSQILRDAFDGDLIQELMKSLSDMSNVQVRTGVNLTHVDVADEGNDPDDPDAGRVRCVVDGTGEVIEADTYLHALGRVGNAPRGLADLGVSVSRNGMITVDKDTLYSGQGIIYAVGDVAAAGLVSLGLTQVDKLVAGLVGIAMDKLSFQPAAVWTIPDVAFVGVSEEKAKALHGAERVGSSVARFRDTIKGAVKAYEVESGFLKLVFTKPEGVVIGVHICGTGSAEIISYGAILVNHGLTLVDSTKMAFPAVTYHELYTKAAFTGILKLRGVRESVRANIAWKHTRVDMLKEK